MRDNPQAGAEAAFALPDHTVIELHGPDATRFAQAQFRSDVAALPCGHWHWSGWLTPKGRVVAVFAVLKLADERLWLLLPDAPPTPFADALRRFVFRSKLTIAVRDDLHVQGTFAAAESASGSAFAGDAGAAIELDFSAGGGERSVITSREPVATSDPDVARWTAFDLAHGLPRLDAAQAGHWTPQQLSLERLRAFSIKKGCYPGQEIVARTHFLGKAKRGLVLVESDQTLAAGTQLRVAGTEVAVGTLVAAANQDDRHLGLAVLPLERNAGALNIDGIAVREIALHDGLER